MLQEGGSHQTEQQMSEMIKENLTLSVKKGEYYRNQLVTNSFYSEISSAKANQS